MDIREAFSTIVSLLRENDGNYGCSSSTYTVERSKLTRIGRHVFETALAAEADYLDDENNVILTVTMSDDGGYLVRSRPFVWEPHDQYGFSCKMFSHLFRKYDPQLVESCVKVARENDGMLYSEVRTTHGVRRCHYGIRVYNNHTGTWDGVYEGTFKL